MAMLRAHNHGQYIPVGIKLETHAVPLYRHKVTTPRFQKSVLSIEWWVTTPQKKTPGLYNGDALLSEKRSMVSI